jgi:hypothetical protein
VSSRQGAPDFFDDLRPEAVIEIDKETGCHMSSAGTRPEFDWAFLYHDNKYHFYFYADRKWEGQTFDASVRSFSSKRFAGATPYLLKSYLPTIKKNMEKFFRERDFISSSQPCRASEVFHSLNFDWDSYAQKFLL